MFSLPDRNTEFEARVGLMEQTGASGTAYDIVKKYVEDKVGKFTGADVVAGCPSIGRSSALATLKKLTSEGLILRQGAGRGTFYIKADSMMNHPPSLLKEDLHSGKVL